MAKDFGEHIPAAPFVAVINAELERLAQLDVFRGDDQSQVPAQRMLADRVGVAERTLYRYKNSLDGDSNPTETYARNPVEDALDRLDMRFEDVYPEIAAADDVDLEADAYCVSCHEVVTPINGACPWCDRSTTAEIPKRMYCEREDKTSFAAVDGNCWRCGGELRPHVPYVECACGKCKTMIARFDSHGREVKYVRGHAPRTLERAKAVDVGPFAEWLERELRDLDPIEAVARRVGLSRELVLAVLNRRVEHVALADVRKALWISARAGQGKAMPPRPGATRLAELYPEHVRSRTCPECGGGKAPHAELCKQCRRKAPIHGKKAGSVTAELLLEAKRLRDVERMTFRDIAVELQPRSRCTNSESLANSLREEFAKRGWPTHRLDRERGIAA